MSKKQNLKDHIGKHYDYAPKLTICRINKDLKFGCTVKECIEIHNELFGVNAWFRQF